MTKEEVLDVYFKVIKEYGLKTYAELSIATYYLSTKQNMTQEEFDVVANHVISYDIDHFFEHVKGKNTCELIKSKHLLLALNYAYSSERLRWFMHSDASNIINILNYSFDYDNDKLSDVFIQNIKNQPEDAHSESEVDGWWEL